MPSIQILDSGRIDERESAFPQCAQMPNGDIVCGYCWGAGASGTGSSDWSRSTDGGKTWTREGTLLAKTDSTGNHLKISGSADGKTLFAYGGRNYREPAERFGDGRTEAVFVKSTDGGKTWSGPQAVPMMGFNPIEVSHGILALKSGRLLAPCATLPKGKLGEQILAAVSDDGGKTWPRHAVVMKDPNGKNGYFEQKLAEYAPGKLIATAWTVTLSDVADLENSYTLSSDDGLTWSAPVSTGIRGQTMSTLPLGGDRLLVLYNKRYGDQKIVMHLVTFTDKKWTIHAEETLYDAKAKHEKPKDIKTGVDELAAFKFGFPTAVRLKDGTILATNWSQESGKTGIRWTKLKVSW